MTPAPPAFSGSDPVITRHQEVWARKPALRLVYEQDIFRRVRQALSPGRTLEIAGGPGFLARHLPDSLSSDILTLPHLDLVCDAQHLPVRDASLDNVVGIDGLHHLPNPARFFQECVRALRPGGRVVLAEPWISPASRLVYTYLHHEACERVDDPLHAPFQGGKDPWAGNAMIPFSIFGGHGVAKFSQEFPNLRLLELTPFAILAYPLSGGFQEKGVRSLFCMRALLALEDALRPVLTPLMAFRALLVLERR